MNAVLVALAVTLAVEIPVVALVYKGERVRMALACAGVTAATNLTMNTLLLRVAPSIESYLLIGEVGAVVLEAAAYVWISKSRDLGRALVASALANSLSYAAGLWLF
ncbi:MAG: hypothetical protein R3B13_30200 [Polyangiaceae bacterium]